MATQTTTETTAKLERPAGKTADINLSADLSKFTLPSNTEEYENAVAIIKSKLEKLSACNALFSVNLGTNQQELVIDSRGDTAAKLVADSAAARPESLDCKLTIRPVMVQRFADGVMDARYGMSYAHILVNGPTRVGLKFLDAIGPFNPTHPKLDRTRLDSLPQPTEDVARVKRDLADWGYGLYKNALSPEEVESLSRRLGDQARGEKEAGVAYFDGGESRPNQRVWNLPNKGHEFLDLLEENKTIEKFVPDFLGDDAIIFSYTANIAKPGNVAMHLHTDQITIQPPIRDVAMGLNLMFFLTDVTPENGGTLVMPGSHKGNLAPDDVYDTADTVAAAGPAGTCLVFESRLWHGTGPNTVPGSERPVLLVFFMRPFVRQQENFFLSMRDDVYSSLSDKLKGYFGWRSTGSMGGVQGKTKDGAIVERPVNPIGRLGDAQPQVRARTR